MIENRERPRAAIEKLLAEGDLEALFEKAAEIHGHYCSHLALGVKATYIAFEKLGIGESSGMEEIMVIAECNNCFIDGIQAISGCTVGNNALIYKYLGKTAATFITRKENTALRIVVTTSDEEMDDDPENREAMDLFTRAVKNREELKPVEEQRYRELGLKFAFRTLKRQDNEVFKIENVEAEKLEYAPIFDSMKCTAGGENVMETHIRMKKQKPVCISCAGDDYLMVSGRGIHPTNKR